MAQYVTLCLDISLYVRPCHGKISFFENYRSHTLPRLVTAKKLKMP